MTKNWRGMILAKHGMTREAMAWHGRDVADFSVQLDPDGRIEFKHAEKVSSGYQLTVWGFYVPETLIAILREGSLGIYVATAPNVQATWRVCLAGAPRT